MLHHQSVDIRGSMVDTMMIFIEKEAMETMVDAQDIIHHYNIDIQLYHNIFLLVENNICTI